MSADIRVTGGREASLSALRKAMRLASDIDLVAHHLLEATTAPEYGRLHRQVALQGLDGALEDLQELRGSILAAAPVATCDGPLTAENITAAMDALRGWK
jgi:hypothetical protein